MRNLTYGAPGIGKTRFLGTAPKALFLVNSKSETVAVQNQDAQVWELSSHQEAIEAAEYCQHEGHRDFEHVIIDNGTLMMDANMRFIMDDLVALKPHRNLYVPDQAEYLLNQNQFMKFITEMHRAPMHVWLTAHVMRIEDPISEEDMILPAFPGTRGLYSQKIAGLMNTVFYMGAKRKEGKTQRYIITGQSGKIQAKDRYEVLPRRMDEPTVPAIMAAVGATLPSPSKTTKRTTRKKTAPTRSK